MRYQYEQVTADGAVLSSRQFDDALSAQNHLIKVLETVLLLKYGHEWAQFLTDEIRRLKDHDTPLPWKVTLANGSHIGVREIDLA